MKIKFEKLGLDDERLNNIKNFRIMSEEFENKDGKNIVLELSLFHRLEREKGKKCIYAQVNRYDDKGNCWGNVPFEISIADTELEYNLENVLKVVNMLSKKTFTGIEFI